MSKKNIFEEELMSRKTDIKSLKLSIKKVRGQNYNIVCTEKFICLSLFTT